jgi:hypothetical protein
MTQYKPSTDNTGSYLCDYCEKQIPTKKNVLQDWVVYEVSGMFCSEKCADTADGDATYQPICNRELV